MSNSYHDMNGNVKKFWNRNYQAINFHVKTLHKNIVTFWSNIQRLKNEYWQPKINK